MEVTSFFERELWDSYVKEKFPSFLYVHSGWKFIIEKTFGHKTFYLSCLKEDVVCGVLPLVLFKSKLFGRFLVSVPFVNYGGIHADNEAAAKELYNAAVLIAEEENAGFVEFRHVVPQPLKAISKEKKVTFLLSLEQGVDELWKTIGSKVRNQVRKAEKAGCESQAGGVELLDKFYRVFARNMRDLGTPVYSKKFFENIAETFPDLIKIFVVSLNNKSVAAAFTIGYAGTIEIPWASSLREYNRQCPNMLMYWKIIEYGALNGFKVFDFGRGTKAGHTYHFKKQWGGEEVQLTWQYWIPDGDVLPEVNPDNQKYKTAIKIWQKMPVWITKALGPLIIKNIP